MKPIISILITKATIMRRKNNQYNYLLNVKCLLDQSMIKNAAILWKAVLIFTLGLFFLLQNLNAQFSMSGQFRPRSEYTHGFKQLAGEDMDFGLFTSQRTRLYFNYDNEFVQTKISLQDIRVFGATNQLNESDGFSSIHEAWAEAKLHSHFTIRIGRQELNYDDARILGNVDWAQQARSHDIFLFKYENNYKFHAGFALNNHKQNLNSGFYEISKNYKAMQFLWIHRKLINWQFSFLFLNNGMQYLQYPDNTINPGLKTVYSQTIGGRFEYELSSITLKSNFYAQLGKDEMNRALQGFNSLVEVYYSVGESWNIGLGYEYLSGGAGLNSEGQFINRAFNPLYGTNHKFNGLMDYFYVGNHLNSVGLSDIYLMLGYELNSRLKLQTHLHYFSSTADILLLQNAIEPSKEFRRELGVEFDFFASYQLNPITGLVVGYSQIHGTESMEALKGGSKDALSNWIWVMMTFSPLFLKY